MAQWLSMLAALSEILSSVPSAHLGCLTTAYNSTFGGSSILF